MEITQEQLARDVKLLQNAGVATDGPGLVEFFRKQTLSDEQRRAIAKLITQLGDDNFPVRERATQELKALGPVAVPALQQALNHADVEVAARAKRCLSALKNIPAADLLVAAVRVLAARKPVDGVETLLAYLPENAHPEVEEEIVNALMTLGVRDGEMDPALVRSLKDPRPVCRAIGAEVLGSTRNASHREAVRKLLTDPDRAVRLHVAMSLRGRLKRGQTPCAWYQFCPFSTAESMQGQGVRPLFRRPLSYARDKAAVPVLIDLVAELPRDQARPAEDLLRRLASARAPRIRSGDRAAERKQYRDAWNAWWKEHGGSVNPDRLEAGPPRKAKVSARASATWNNEVTPDKPFNLDQPTTWNSGGYAPQWIEADLGAFSQLASIRLVITMSPDGPTTHEVWVSQEPIGEDRTKAKLAHTLNGPNRNLEAIKFDFPQGLPARYVQIRTTQSPSWVAWVAIELYVGRTRPSFVKAGVK
jgi:HEAT repeat protein